MHAILVLLAGWFVKILIFRILASLGIGVITYVGGQYLLNHIMSLLLSYANQLPSQWIGILGYVQMDHAISMIFSAMTVALTIKSSKKVIGVR